MWKQCIIGITLIFTATVAFLLMPRGSILNTGKHSAAPTSLSFNALQIPSVYFKNADVKWDSADNNGGWTDAAIKNGDGYQSYPTSIVTYTDYSNELKPLPPIQTWKEIMAQDRAYSGTIQFFDTYKQNIAQYGNLASRYLPISTIYTKSFDVDGDGKKETLVFLSNVGGSHGSQEVQIIKNNKVIFTAHDSGGEGIDIMPSDTGNGFYTNTTNDDLNRNGLCCSLGYIKTRFVYDGEVFKPLYEQTVYYLNVQNGTSIGNGVNLN